MDRLEFLLLAVVGTPLPRLTPGDWRSPTTRAYVDSYRARLRQLRSRVSMATLYHFDDNGAIIEATIWPETLEKQGKHVIVSDPREFESLVDTILASHISPILSSNGPTANERWGIVFQDAQRRRLWSIYLEKFGDVGMTQDFRSVSFGGDKRIYNWLQSRVHLFDSGW